MVGLFVFGTLWFWVGIIALITAAVVSVENEKGVLSGVFVFLFAVFLNFFVGIPLVHSIFIHPFVTLAFFAVYLLLGVGWSVFKWYIFLKDSYAKYIFWKESFLLDHKVTSFEELSDEKQRLFKLKIGTSKYFNPKVFEYKSDITFWMTYWPFSILGSLLNDFVRKIFSHLYNEISGGLQRMSDKMFANAASEIK